MLSVTNTRKILEERKISINDKKLKVKILSSADTKLLQQAVRVKYKKAFDALKDM